MTPTVTLSDLLKRLHAHVLNSLLLQFFNLSSDIWGGAEEALYANTGQSLDKEANGPIRET